MWEGEGWPEEWKEGIIVPILKKGEGREVRDYRGVALLPTIYKIYVAVLAERLREEVERKKMIPHNQTGFRNGMGTTDNIYVLNYLIGRQVGRKGGKMIAMFVDLRAAFDSMDRGNDRGDEGEGGKGESDKEGRGGDGGDKMQSKSERGGE